MILNSFSAIFRLSTANGVGFKEVGSPGVVILWCFRDILFFCCRPETPLGVKLNIWKESIMCLKICSEHDLETSAIMHLQATSRRTVWLRGKLMIPYMLIGVSIDAECYKWICLGLCLWGTVFVFLSNKVPNVWAIPWQFCLPMTTSTSILPVCRLSSLSDIGDQGSLMKQCTHEWRTGLITSRKSISDRMVNFACLEWMNNWQSRDLIIVYWYSMIRRVLMWLVNE